MKTAKNEEGNFEAYVYEDMHFGFEAMVYYEQDSSGFKRQYTYGDTPEEARDNLIEILYEKNVVFPQFKEKSC